ncbi:hypothetical protein PVK06_023831 [Gossypium arboreum]|uniref:Uncharacterized protein n=1 Tax=Gossypium arboreum TaxID=29729 RepID=A0ABR0PCD0_GOSAR|nr:hypothetical protein PVK06_023831 [Gossypium arboreum]
MAGSPTCDPDWSHHMVECKVNRERTTKGVHGSSSQEPREGHGLSSYAFKELVEGRPRAL